MKSWGRSIGLLLSMVLVICAIGCAGVLPKPGTTPTAGSDGGTLNDAKAARIEGLKKSIVAVHEGLYVPIMSTLGALYDAGNPTVRMNAAHIQIASETYVRLKKQATDAITTLGGGADSEVSALMKLMLDTILDLQRLRSSAAGSNAPGT